MITTERSTVKFLLVLYPSKSFSRSRPALPSFLLILTDDVRVIVKVSQLRLHWAAAVAFCVPSLRSWVISSNLHSIISIFHGSSNERLWVGHVLITWNFSDVDYYFPLDSVENWSSFSSALLQFVWMHRDDGRTGAGDKCLQSSCLGALYFYAVFFRHLNNNNAR